MCNTNVIFRIRLSKEETCIKQVITGIFYFQILRHFCDLKFLRCLCLHLEHVTNLGIICNSNLTRIILLSHI
jgi:hypothetical protein